MEKLVINESPSFLFISLEDGLIQFKGRAIIEDPIAKFSPVFNWIKSYKPNEASTTTVNFYIEYLNSTSSKCVMDVLFMLDSLVDKGHPISVNWYYEAEDEDMLEVGIHLKENLKMPFEFIESAN
jgi:hypothetical protein